MKQCSGCKEKQSKDMFLNEKARYCKRCLEVIKIRNWYEAARFYSYKCQKCKRSYDHKIKFFFKYKKKEEASLCIGQQLRQHCSDRKWDEYIYNELDKCMFLCENCFKERRVGGLAPAPQ